MQSAPRSAPAGNGLWLLLLAAALAVYVCGLGSAYAPTNGDEMVYTHIARRTLESGHWLPLVSDIANMRNTKPPLLFWQAIVAGDWGAHWSLFWLRLPSIFYTFATTACIALLAHRMTGKVRSACIAAIAYLVFFSSFRYGRAYLTSAPETFWLALPLFWLIWKRITATTADRSLSFAAYALFGVSMGIGLAYKSFALIAPASATLWTLILLTEKRLASRTVLRTTAGVTLSSVIALAIFGLWFALDPDPGAVWREFVIGENAGKMSGTQGYWHAALYGAYPMWTQLLAYPENGGLLLFVVIGLAWLGGQTQWQRGGNFNADKSFWMLLVWAGIWLAVFTIPSQRSARYVIPAMPAIALLLALCWDRIARPWFWLTLALTGVPLVILARIGWVMGELKIASATEVGVTLAMAAAGLVAVAAGCMCPAWTRAAALAACLSLYATFGLMVAPLDAGDARYDEALQNRLAGATVAVPNGFTGQYERFHFLLPKSTLAPFDAEGRATGALQPLLASDQRLMHLLNTHAAVVWVQDSLEQTSPSCLPQCTVLHTRWHVKSRHQSGEVTWDNLWYPQQWLFRHEWLLVKATP
jgi:4-amino-4-deoxy-L-arabinose transferase-like glycosyltransferase